MKVLYGSKAGAFCNKVTALKWYYEVLIPFYSSIVSKAINTRFCSFIKLVMDLKSVNLHRTIEPCAVELAIGNCLSLYLYMGPAIVRQTRFHSSFLHMQTDIIHKGVIPENIFTQYRLIQ